MAAGPLQYAWPVRVLVAALAAGCYSPAYQAGSACDSVCPGDLVCIENVCREPGFVPADAAIDVAIDAPPIDTDGDSRFDFEDNCPTAPNMDQHDEDGDDLGDECDPCPHLSGTAADADGDGVGDACDPQPALAKQTIVFFDPFKSTRPEWTLDPEYSRMGDQLRLTGTDGTARVAVPTGELRIVTGGTVQQLGASMPRSLSLGFGYNDSGSDYYYGNFYENGGGTSISVTRADSGSYTPVAGTGIAGSFPIGAFIMQVDESVSSQQLSIVGTLGGTSYPIQAGTAGTPPLVANDFIAIYARNAEFRFDYFLVIETDL